MVQLFYYLQFALNQVESHYYDTAPDIKPNITVMNDDEELYFLIEDK